jgi:hypothetical protein
MVSVLAIGLRFAGLNPAVGDELLRAIRIRRMPSFGEELEPSVPCRKVLRNVKYACGI